MKKVNLKFDLDKINSKNIYELIREVYALAIKEIDINNPELNAKELLSLIGKKFFSKEDIDDDHSLKVTISSIVMYFDNTLDNFFKETLIVRNEIIKIGELVPLLLKDVTDYNIYKQLRQERHYSIEELAVKINRKISTIKSWENSRSHPNINSMVKLSILYNIPVKNLLAEKHK